MGLVRTPSVRSGGDFTIEGMFGDYVSTKGHNGGGNGKASMVLRGGGGGKLAVSRVVTALTVLQFAFAAYATFLLYYMSPAVDLRTTAKPDLSWTTRLAQQVKHYVNVAQPRMLTSTFGGWDSNYGGLPMLPSQVCEREEIDFNQKKSEDALMIRLKRELYEEVREFQKRSFGREKLDELMAMKSRWDTKVDVPKITIILNHFKRKALSVQLDPPVPQRLGPVLRVAQRAHSPATRSPTPSTWTARWTRPRSRP